MANVTLYKPGGKTLIKSAEGADYYVSNYGWSKTPIDAPVSTPKWDISSWATTGVGGWKQQPILTIEKQQFKFGTPQEYLSRLQKMEGGDIDRVRKELGNANFQWQNVGNVEAVIQAAKNAGADTGFKSRYSIPGDLEGPKGNVITLIDSSGKTMNVHPVQLMNANYAAMGYSFYNRETKQRIPINFTQGIQSQATRTQSIQQTNNNNMATPKPNAWNPNTTTVYSSSGNPREIPIGEYNKYISKGWKTTKIVAPASISSAPVYKPPASTSTTSISSSDKPTVNVYQPTLIEITSQRPDVLDAARKQGGDPYTAGTEANRWLNDWYNRVGKAEGADMAKRGLFDKPAETKPLAPIADVADKEMPVDTEKKYPMAIKTTRSLIDIANSRPDVLNAAKEQGGDPFTMGTPANTWLNDWWNTAGKNEFPDVILGPPQDEQSKFTDDANKIQNELFDNLPKGDDLDKSDAQRILDEILEKYESEDAVEAGPPPSMAELFATEKAKLGMEPLEEDLARIDSEIDIINSELLIQQGELTGGQDLVTSRQLGRRKGTLQKEADDRILRLNIEKGIVSRQLNNKISTLNMIMQFSQQDYQNSSSYYKSEFEKSITMYELLTDEEDRELDIEEKAEQDAKANWTVLYNAIKDGTIDYKNLTTDQKLQIKNLETQAGLPVGFMELTMNRDPIGKVQTVTSRTDSAGNTYYDVLKIAPDGTITVDTIYRGKAKVASSGSGGYAPSSTKKEWLERGGEAGTGLTLNEYFDSKDSDGDTTDSDRNAIMGDVSSITGNDGYVDPGKMKALRQDIALNNPELLSWFDKAFQPKDMLNPEYYSYEIDENEWAI
jgi:hypothetical protein